MNYFNDRDLLTVWEFGVHHSLLETNLYLLSVAYPEFDLKQIASFSIGERDIRLLLVRENFFGPVFHNTSNCTACGQKIEWETTVDALKLQSIREEVKSEPISLMYNDHPVLFRLPNSQDVLEVIPDDENNQVNEIIRRCLLPSSQTTSLPKVIPQDLKNRIIQKMEENDPQANIEMHLTCPECENEWNATFDIMQFLWTEINDWAIHLLQDIYVLASRCGWSERDILNMSRLRRSMYLNMINQ